MRLPLHALPVLLAVAPALAVPAGAAPALQTVRLPVPGHGALELRLPVEWQSTLVVREAAGDAPAGATLDLSPSSGDGFRLELVATAGSFADAVGWEDVATTRAEAFRAQAGKPDEEEGVGLMSTGPGPTGVVLVTASLKAPAPGALAHRAYGVAVRGNLRVTFRLEQRARDTPEQAALLRALDGARQVDLRPARTEPLALLLPGGKLALAGALPGWAADPPVTMGEGRTARTAANAKEGVIVRLEALPAPGPGAAACREADLATTIMGGRAQLVLSEQGGMALATFVARPAPGEPRALQVVGYLADGDACAVVRFVKPRAADGDREKLLALLGGFQLLPALAVAP